MDLKEAVAIAKQRVSELCAPDSPQNMRLEQFLYDDHLAVWSLTIGFALSTRGQEPSTPPLARNYKVVRVSEANKSVLSISDK